MDIENAFADPEAEKEGVWIDYRGGSKIKIARLGNSKFRRLQSAKLKPHLRKYREGTLDDELETNILCEVIAKTVLLGWEGFDKGGKPLKYSEKAATDLLIEHMDFRNDIVDLATKEENFFAEVVEDAEKNL